MNEIASLALAMTWFAEYLAYDIMAILDVVGGGSNKELVGTTKYDKE